ncbi:MAG: carboxylating nicotinate-nucleotide diphosphorylase [Acidimicrobiales bacterium]
MIGGAAHPSMIVVRDAVARALAEDLTPLGDLSSTLLPPGLSATAEFVPRADGVLAGVRCAIEAFAQIDPALKVTWQADDGDWVERGRPIGMVAGALTSILGGERTALNFLTHLSGVATQTRRFVEAVAAVGGRARIWDTRKTTPGLRALEKAAVRAGGGVNHRGNLSEWVMLKDNHLAHLGIEDGIRVARAQWPGRLVHVECESEEQVEAALAAGADAILLDNMRPEDVRACVALAHEVASRLGGRRPLLEVSGGITLENVGAYAAAGADLISSGAITMSAPALDIGLDAR